MRSGSRVVDYVTWITSRELRLTNYVSRIASRELRLTDHVSRIASHALRRAPSRIGSGANGSRFVQHIPYTASDA